MKRTSSWAGRSVLGAGIFAFTVSSTALSQGSTNPFSFGVSAGASIPVGDLANGVKTGFNVGAQVGVRQPMWPVGLRLDGQFNRFKSKNETENFNFDITSVSLDVVFMPSGMTSPLKPYFLAGPSYFHSSAGFQGVSTSSNDWGLNAGAGVEYLLTGFSTFLEARYDWIHTGNGSDSFIPISVGIKIP